MIFWNSGWIGKPRLDGASAGQKYLLQCQTFAASMLPFAGKLTALVGISGAAATVIVTTVAVIATAVTTAVAVITIAAIRIITFATTAVFMVALSEMFSKPTVSLVVSETDSVFTVVSTAELIQTFAHLPVVQSVLGSAPTPVQMTGSPVFFWSR